MRWIARKRKDSLGFAGLRRIDPDSRKETKTGKEGSKALAFGRGR